MKMFSIENAVVAIVLVLFFFVGVSLEANAQAPKTKVIKNKFIHQVYFWLKNPDNKAEADKLYNAIQELKKIKSISEIHIGVPANTKSPIINSTYHFSLLTIFEDQAKQDEYGVDPIHTAFLKNNANLWEKVEVFDAVDKP